MTLPQFEMAIYENLWMVKTIYLIKIIVTIQLVY